jgi:methylmalonyl-CoA mutase
MATDDSLSPLFEEFSATPTHKWEAKIREDVGANDVASALQWDSIEGFSLNAFYRRDDLDSISHVSSGSASPPLAAAEASPAND